MNELADRTRRVLDFLTRAKEAGESPTVREIKSGTGISSSSVVEYHLGKLEGIGFIERRPRQARGIRLLKGPTGDVVMVFRGEDAELVRAVFGERPAEALVAYLSERPHLRAGG